MLGNNLKSFLFGGTQNAELRETRYAWDETQAYWRASPLAKNDASDFALALVLEAVANAERAPAVSVLVAVCEAVETLYRAENIAALEAQWPVIETSIEAAVEFRQMMPRRKRWAVEFPNMHSAFKRIVLATIQEFFRSLPESCFGDWDTARNDTFETPLIDLLDDPAKVIDGLFMLPYDDASFRLDIFNRLRELCVSNLLIASGFLPTDNIREREPKLIRPPQQKKKTGAELAELYLNGSPLKALLDIPVPFRIPDELRFEHCHIVGGTGHGKTQLMQKMIHADLLASQEDERSVIVIDSQGDLINKLMRLDIFSPYKPGSLSDRLIVIDPSDVEWPAALNLFDAHLDRVKSYSAADRERVLNGVIELYEMFFGAFLGAELTQKQGVIFKYLARLMLAIPDSTIYTLMKIMEDGKPFKQYMDDLDGSARYFFETEFFHPSFAATKKQVLRRLWGVLSTPAFERMFTQPKNKIDLFEAMNDGKIILVNTAKDLLKREGSQLLGRFFIAMITQGALERSTIPEHRRRSVFVYVDEAQEYFDDSIETILNQARKYRVPELCNFEGQAIYMDSDMIVLDDIAKLWEQEFEPGKAMLTKQDRDDPEKWRFCVIKWNCAAAKEHLEPMADFRTRRNGHQRTKNYFRNSRATQAFKENWNCVDGEDYESLDDPDIKILHYSGENTQPQLRYALPRLAAAGKSHWFDGTTKPHWRSDVVALFDRMLDEAKVAGFDPKNYEPADPFGPYRLKSHANYKGNKWTRQ